MSTSIYPALLAIPVSAPLSLGKGFVGDHLVSTIFVSGANIMAVDRRLVPKSPYMGRYIHCCTFSGRTEIFP